MIPEHPQIVWAGDSTVALNHFKSFPQTGLGQGLQLYLKQSVLLLNLAVNGRSTKSFIDEQRLADAYFALNENDFLFIQFGHNDQKAADPARYTDPQGEFRDNLYKFLRVAEGRKAHPVLITPVTRRSFGPDGRLEDTMGEYPSVVRSVACETGTPLIDLYKRSTAYVEQLGPEASERLYMNFPEGLYPNYPDGLEDNTHLTVEGAKDFAGLIADELWQLGDPYRALLLPEVEARIRKHSLQEQ